MTEIFKDIQGYEGLYQISNTGKVKNIIRNSILKPGIGTTGYYLVILCKNKVKKTSKVHRLVAKAFIENPDNLPFVNHKDSNRLNNHISNLEWCDNSGNMQHCFNKGRGKIPVMNGTKNVNAKLNDELVIEMRRKFSNGVLRVRIAEEYGLSISTVCRVISKKLWAHVA